MGHGGYTTCGLGELLKYHKSIQLFKEHREPLSDPELSKQIDGCRKLVESMRERICRD